MKNRFTVRIWFLPYTNWLIDWLLMRMLSRLHMWSCWKSTSVLKSISVWYLSLSETPCRNSGELSRFAGARGHDKRLRWKTLVEASQEVNWKLPSFWHLGLYAGAPRPYNWQLQIYSSRKMSVKTALQIL